MRVAGGSGDQGGGVDIPAAHVRQKLPAVGGAVDVHRYADFLQGCLGRFCQQGQLLTAGIGQPANGQLHPVLFPDAVPIGVHPAGLFQYSPGPFRVVGFRGDLLTSEGREAVGEGTAAGNPMAIQQGIHKAFLVDAHGNGFPDGLILKDGAFHVHGTEKGPGGLNGGELIAAVFKVGVSLVCHTVGGVNVPGLQSGGQGVAVGQGTDGQLVKLGGAVPVVFVLGQGQVAVRDHVHHHIGAGADDDACFKVAGIHIDDAAVGVPQIVHQGGIGLAGGDGENLPLCLNVYNLGVAGGTVVDCNQAVQALLDSCSVQLPSVGEGDVVLEGNGPGAVSVATPFLCQPGLQLHVVGVMHQGLADAVADAGPAVVGAVGVHRFLPVFRVEGGIADGHDLPGSGALGIRRGAAFAAGEQRNGKASCHHEKKCFFHFLFPFVRNL